MNKLTLSSSCHFEVYLIDLSVLASHLLGNLIEQVARVHNYLVNALVRDQLPLLLLLSKHKLFGAHKCTVCYWLSEWKWMVSHDALLLVQLFLFLNHLSDLKLLAADVHRWRSVDAVRIHH